MKKLLLMWLFVLLLSTISFAVTPVVRYVDPGASGAGNGTSWGDAYTSLEAWNLAEAEDITAGGSDEIHTVNCKTTGGADTTRVIMNGWTTDDTHTITIQVATADRHDGTRGTGYRLVMDDDWEDAFECIEDYVTIDGIAVSNTNANAVHGIYSTGDNCTIKNCLAYDNDDDGINCGSATTNVLVENCICYGNGDDGIEAKTATIKYCTLINNGGSGTEVDSPGTLTVINCYSGGNDANDYGDGGGTTNTTTCHDSDGTGDTTTALATDSGTYFTNVTASSEDPTITSASSGLNGTATSGHTATDFEGDTRDESTPDIGADEYIAAGGGIPILRRRRE